MRINVTKNHVAAVHKGDDILSADLHLPTDDRSWPCVTIDACYVGMRLSEFRKWAVAVEAMIVKHERETK